jgi:hypothetical protein
LLLFLGHTRCAAAARHGSGICARRPAWIIFGLARLRQDFLHARAALLGCVSAGHLQGAPLFFLFVIDITASIHSSYGIRIIFSILSYNPLFAQPFALHASIGTNCVRPSVR